MFVCAFVCMYLLYILYLYTAYAYQGSIGLDTLFDVATNSIVQEDQNNKV